jgi:hypothetical protein
MFCRTVSAYSLTSHQCSARSELCFVKGDDHVSVIDDYVAVIWVEYIRSTPT